MAKLLNFFRPKKNREESPDYEPSQRVRQSSMRQRRNERSTHFEEDFVPDTAPYHTVTQPRSYRGPRSCPGGPMEGRGGTFNRSFETDIQREEQRRHDRHERERRKTAREVDYRTSEYGSGDPSPTTYMIHAPQSFYRVDDSETDEPDLEQEERERNLIRKYTEYRDKYQRMKQDMRTMREKYEEMKRHLKGVEIRQKNTEDALVRSNQRLDEENKKLLNEIKKFKGEVAHYRQQLCHTSSFNSSFHQHGGYSIAAPFESYRNNFPFHSMPTAPAYPNATPTPSTSQMGSLLNQGGAANKDDSVFTDFGILKVSSQTMEEDEMKSFRQPHHSPSVETPRSNPPQISSSSIGIHEDTTALRDEGYSTTATDETKDAKLRRTASDSALSPSRKGSQSLNTQL